MSAQRIIVSGATTSVTRRCNLRKSFLAPWDPRVKHARLYALGDAQRKTAVEVHHSVDVITHSHTSVTPTSANLPEFVRRVNHDSSCALNTLLAMERYDAPRQLFDDREPHYLRLMDAAAQASHLIYEHVNCVAAGIVERPELMPGYTFDFGLWKTGGLWVDRPDFFFGDERPERIFLRVTPPPLLYRAFGGDIDALVHHMRRLTQHAVREIRTARKHPAMGARRARRIHPWSEPNTLRESGGQPVRTFKFGANDLLGRRAEVHGALEITGFRASYREARRGRLSGQTEPRFPYGTYGPRVFHRAPVEPEPHTDALVTAPGPTFEDVQRELDARSERPLEELASEQTPRGIAESVRDAFTSEARELVEDTPMNAPDSPPRVSGMDGGEAACREPGEVHTRRRRDRKPKPRAGEARRVVVHRDRRIGRPRIDATRGSHGSDPPSQE